MDEIYKLMNNTQSSLGEEYLYALLQTMLFIRRTRRKKSPDRIFQSNKEERLQVQIKLNKVGKLRKISVFDYQQTWGEKPKAIYPIILWLLDYYFL